MFKKMFPPIENESNQSPQDPGYINIQRAFWASIIFTAVAVISMGLGIYLVFNYPYWQIYAILAIASLSVVFDVLATILIKRGRAGTGLQILYWSFIVVLPANNFLVPDVGPILAAMTLVAGFINIYLLFPRTWRKFTLVGPFAAALLILLVDYLNPPFRYSIGTLPTTGFFGPFILAFLVVGILIMIIRQAWIAGRINFGIRLTVLTILIVVPVIVAALFFMLTRARNVVETQGAEQLQKANQAMTGNVTIWLNQQAETLNTLVIMQDIVSMDANRQTPVLKAFQSGHPSAYLVHTIDTTGMNIARSDGGELKSYKDRGYFSGPVSGTPFVYQSLISRTTGQPAVCMGAPIHGRSGSIVGVGSICSELIEISQSVQIIKVGETGFAFVVDEKNQVVAHPDSAFTSELSDFSQYPPVAMLRNGQRGLVAFTDAEGQSWHGYVDVLDNGWGVITQQKDSEHLAMAVALQNIALATLIIGIIIIAIATWFFVQQAVRPVTALTKVAEAISAGDLTQAASEERRDEFGVLARTFNNMTRRLQDTLQGLEQRVAERTQSLELAADVGHSVSQVRALDVMLKDAAEIIRSRFDLYYTQVYLTNPNQTELVLQAGTGTVGAELLSRSHRLLLNTGSINGRAAVEKRSVVIADTISSVTFRPNPLLPDTRSEMAVPLIVGEKVVGVLDLQSRTAGGLSEDLLPAFEALAGQLAIAIQNASLLAEAEQARAEVETQARRLVRANWSDYLDAIHKPEHAGFMFEQDQVKPMDDASEAPAENAVSAAIAVTGESIGSIVVELDAEKQTAKNVELVNTIARQVAQQVENLRLLESAERYRFEAEQAVHRVTREGWKTYIESGSGKLGYMYDLKEVIPVEPEREASDNAVTLPIKVRDEEVGKLSLMDVDQNDSQSLELANAVAERLSAHIEGLRQFDQTQSALAQSEKLFEASRELTQSTDLQGLVKATVEALSIPEIDRAILGVLHYDSNNEPDGMTITANWASGTELPATPVGTYYPKEALETLSLFMGPEPLFFNDMLNDERIDEKMKDIPRSLNYRSVAALPLFSGTRHDAVLLLEGKEPHKFTQDEMRLFAALAPQIATVMENRRQYEQAQKQAERESTLNIISQKIQSATTVEAVLQIAARELGHALGAPLTIAQLGIKEK